MLLHLLALWMKQLTRAVYFNDRSISHSFIVLLLAIAEPTIPVFVEIIVVDITVDTGYLF